MFQLVFDLKLLFMPEGGGQVGDKGYLEDIRMVMLFIFLDTKKESNVIIHFY